MNLALFDFDGTITEKDSFQDFMEFVSSVHQSHIFKFYLFLPIIIGHGLGLISMGRFEELLFTFFFKGWKKSYFDEIAEFINRIAYRRC